MTILTASFPNLNLEKEKIEIIFKLIESETNNEEFEKCIKYVCRNIKEFYPSTNIVATILNAGGYKNERNIQEWLQSNNNNRLLHDNEKN